MNWSSSTANPPRWDTVVTATNGDKAIGRHDPVIPAGHCTKVPTEYCTTGLTGIYFYAAPYWICWNGKI